MFSKLLLAVRDTLRTELSLTEHECDVRPSGQPPPKCGQRFVSVYGHSWGPLDVHDPHIGIDEEYGVTCAITIRTGKVPHDKFGTDAYLDGVDGVELLTRKVLGTVHLNQDIINAANTAIDAAYADGDVVPIQEPLRWLYSDPVPRMVSGEWFHAATEGVKGVGGYVIHGMVMEVHFGQARRLQQMSQYLTELGLGE